jgi:general stress protein 26
MRASIIGRLTEALDGPHRDRCWNAVVSARFAGGKDDPALIMLCLSYEEV